MRFDDQADLPAGASFGHADGAFQRIHGFVGQRMLDGGASRPYMFH